MNRNSISSEAARNVAIESSAGGFQRELTSLVNAVVHRRALFAAGRGAAWGIFVATVWELRHLFLFDPEHASRTFLSTPKEALPLVLMFALVGGLVGFVLIAFKGTPSRRAAEAIGLIEQVVPQSRNLLFTAWEAPAGTDRKAANANADINVKIGVEQGTQVELWGLIRQRADRMAAQVRPDALLPWKPTLRELLLATGLWILSLLVVFLLPSGVITSTVEHTAAKLTGNVTIHHVDVEIVPPTYTGRSVTRVRDPQRIEALEGSTINFTVSANASIIGISTDSGSLVSSKTSGESSFHVRAVMQRDGFIVLSALSNTAIDSSATGANDSDPRLITLISIADQRPSVRITKPGHDLIVDSTRSTLPVAIEANDDIGLKTLVLHYTKVSGAGEQFTFVEGELPLHIVRTSAKSWSATGIFRLDSLLLEAGDLIVYRARATDGKPGSTFTESDAFVAERTAQGGIAAAGFALDPDEDRYRASQQMVILKTERLIAARPSLAAEEVVTRAREIAIEQQRVRAEFVFMTGGEFEQEIVANEEGISDLDESHEAEAESDLGAGRMVNRGRAALLSAVRSMSRATLALGETNLTSALRYEKLALDSLQEAFSRQRFLMRALSERESLDPTRRLTGTLDSIAREPHPPITAEPAVVRKELRSILQELQAINDGRVAGSISGAPTGSNQSSPERRQSSLPLLAIRVVQLDPGSVRAQRIANWLQKANHQGSIGTSIEARASADSASRALSLWLSAVTRIDATPQAAVKK